MRARHWRLAAALAIATSLFLGPVAADTFSGEAFLQVDDRGQVVVVLDSAPADGRTDHVFVFAPETPIGGTFEPRTIPVSIAYEVADGQAQLTVLGISSPVFFQLAVNRSGVGDYVSLSRDGAVILKPGVGLLRRSRPERQDPSWDVLPNQFDTDAIIVVNVPGTGPVTIDPDVISCGKDGLVANDSDCTKGGPGATSCSAGCPLAMWRGEEGGVTCKSGYYACCYCLLGVSITNCRSEKCADHLSDPLTPVGRGF